MSGTTDYPASTLSRLRSKGNRWYVYVTVPEALREALGGKRQLRKSTGTTDEREARRRQHSITETLYSELDTVQPNPVKTAYTRLCEALGLDQRHSHGSPDEADLEELLSLARSRFYAVPTGEDLEEDIAIEWIAGRVAGPLAELETVLQGEADLQKKRKISEVAEEAIAKGRTTPSNISYVRLAAKELESLFPDVFGGQEDSFDFT
ncbi:DUF6538 domain-containing protein [Nioella aestuarii]|uniref:DUF6538 domain-containing protein n=1 Tax=Nioella aestuarii TaxID=1662864 RepID=UPI003D7F864F